MLLADVRVSQSLGQGASSEVFSGRSELTGRPCAVKVFHSALGAGPVRWGRFAHVAQQVSRLGDATWATLYTVGETPGGRSYALMELTEGEPLARIVAQRAPLEHRDILPLFKQICNALGLAHARGLAHLRLHGGNVMVHRVSNGPPEIKLLDFGVYHLHPSLAEPPSGLALGPEHAQWIAPEQARGEPGDARSDVYALGILLYQLTTGHVPLLGADYASTLEQHASSVPRPPGELTSISMEVESAIMRALEKDPRKRVPSVEALLSAVDPVAATTGRHQVFARTHHSRKRQLSTAEHRLLQQRRPDSADQTPSGGVRRREVESSTQRPLWRRHRALTIAGLALSLLVLVTVAVCTLV